MDIQDLLTIHANLDQLMLSIKVGGLPSTVRPQQLKNIEGTQEIIEQLVTWVKGKRLK